MLEAPPRAQLATLHLECKNMDRGRMKGGSEKGEQELKTRRQRKWERVETREGTNSENCRSWTALGAPCPAEGTALGLSLTPRQGRGRAPRAGTAPCPGLSTALCSAEPSRSRRQLTVLSAPHGESRSPLFPAGFPGDQEHPHTPSSLHCGQGEPGAQPCAEFQRGGDSSSA